MKIFNIHYMEGKEKLDYINQYAEAGDVVVVKKVNMIRAANGKFICEFGRLFNTSDIYEEARAIVIRESENDSLIDALVTGNNYKSYKYS